MSNNKLITYGIYLVTLLSVLVILASTIRNELDKRAGIKPQEPEAHFTKTDLYLNFPPIVSNGTVKVKALKLKIPIKYLADRPLSTTMNKMFSPIFSKQFFKKDEIMSVSLDLGPNAEPAERIDFTKSDTPEVIAAKQRIRNSQYYVSIYRNDYFEPPSSRSDLDRRIKIWVLGNSDPMREADLDGLERYVRADCYSDEELNGPSGKRNGEELASKATDDKTPSNCRSNRSQQFLVLPIENTRPEDFVEIDCNESWCHSNFAIQGHRVNMLISKENSFSDYTYRVSKEREALTPRAPFKQFPQPLINEVFTDLPRWRERVEPVQKLLNSFVIQEN